MVFPFNHSGGAVWPRAQNTAVKEKQWTSSFSKGDKEDQMCFLSPVMCSTESKHWSVWAAHPCRSAVNVQLLVSFFAALGWINNFMQAKLQLSVYVSEHSFILGRESHRVCMAVFFVRELYLVWRKQCVYFLDAFRSSHIVKANIDLSFFFLDLLHLSTFSLCFSQK